MAYKTSTDFAKGVKSAAARRVAAKAAKSRKVATSSASKAKKAAKPKLLSGGNPQIAKAGGDAPVQRYIAAMPGWKRNVGLRLDAFIVRTVPNVRKRVCGSRLIGAFHPRGELFTAQRLHFEHVEHILGSAIFRRGPCLWRGAQRVSFDDGRSTSERRASP